MFHLTVCSWSSHWSVQDYLQQNGGLHCRHRQSTGINPSSSFDRQLYVVSQFNVFFATAENRSKISTLHTWRSQGWKSSSMNSHCTKRKYSLLFVHQRHEMSRNAVRQEKIFLRNSNADQILKFMFPPEQMQNWSRCFQLFLHNSEITGWLSPDEDAPSCGLFHSPIKDLPDITFDQTM